MDLGPLSTASPPDPPKPSRLLADPLFHLESQRQVSSRHLRRLKRLQQQAAAGTSDAHFIGAAEEQAKDVHLAKIRLKADLEILATMIKELRSASAERRKVWRWSMPILYVFPTRPELDRLELGGGPLLSLKENSVVPIVMLEHLIPLPRLQRNGAIVLAIGLLAAQGVRRETAPTIYKLLHERVMWLKDTITIQESATERIIDQDIATETTTTPLTSSKSEDEDILGQRWWSLLPYL